MQGYCLVLVFVVRAPVFFPFCISIFGTQPKQRTTFILSIALGLVLLCFAFPSFFIQEKLTMYLKLYIREICRRK